MTGVGLQTDLPSEPQYSGMLPMRDLSTQNTNQNSNSSRSIPMAGITVNGTFRPQTASEVSMADIYNAPRPVSQYVQPLNAVQYALATGNLLAPFNGGGYNISTQYMPATPMYNQQPMYTQSLMGLYQGYPTGSC